VWAYKDARLRGDDAAADLAWRAFRQTKQQLRERGDDWFVCAATSAIVGLAAAFDDIGGAAQELLEWYPQVDTRDLGRNNDKGRTNARNFVWACINVLEREASIDHPREAAVDAAMRDVAARAEEY
jgi:hypothetical protein